jgi:hypothetical protein
MAERYTIHDQLGAGGVGTVYRAYDHQLGRWVAIKRLMSAGEESDNGARVAELRREADALASLRNPNIVTIFDVASDAQGLFLVMELLEGEDLADVVARGPLHYDDFKELASQTLEALLAAHQRHILHRDIKPENIKVERLPGGRMQSKIIDFGLARSGQRVGKQTEDLDGTVMGSVFYMAPEQLTRRPVDERTDLYSLGAVFYEALSGSKAFDGPTVAAVIDKHVNHEIVPLHVIAPHVPPWLGSWVLRLMARNPDDRPTGAQQAIEEFRAWERVASAPMMMPWMPMGYGIAPPTQLPEVIPVAKPVVEMAAQTGALPPRRTTAQVTRPGGNRSSAKVRPAVRRPATQSLQGQSRAASRPVARWGLAAAGLLLLAVALWFWFGRSRPAPPAAAVAPAAADTAPPLFQLPEERVFPPAGEDLSLHLVVDAGAVGAGTGEAGRPAPAGLNSPVQFWYDLAERGGSDRLAPPRGRAGPLRVTWPAATGFTGVRKGRQALRFRREPGADSQLTAEAREPEQMPFGRDAVRGRRGLTLAVVFQADADRLPARVLELAGGADGVSLQVAANGAVRAECRSGGSKAGLVLEQLDARRPCLVLLTWDAASGEVGLRGREASGRTVEAKPVKLPAPGVALTRITLGGAGVTGDDAFQGHLAEVLVHASALSADQAQLLAGKQLPDHHFNALTDPKLPRLRPLPERLTTKKPRVGPRSGWQVEASEHAEDAWLAVDGNPATRWRTAKPQAVGQSFQIGLPAVREISGLALDVASVPGEQVRACRVEVSEDGKSWSEVASGGGTQPVLEILFPKPVKARYLRVSVLGSQGGGRWGLAELEIFAR